MLSAHKKLAQGNPVHEPCPGANGAAYSYGIKGIQQYTWHLLGVFSFLLQFRYENKNRSKNAPKNTGIAHTACVGKLHQI